MSVIDLIVAHDQQNMRAFLQAIRFGEGTYSEKGYRTMFGGEQFTSYADHPRKKITRKLGNQTLTSTAAGAYQFLERTWDGLVKQYGFNDFSPRNQDLGAVALIKGRKALDDVLAGRMESAVKKCALEWASLPGSPYGQPVVSMAKFRELYLANGGVECSDSKPSSGAQSPSSSPSREPGSQQSGSADQTQPQTSLSAMLSGLFRQISKLLTPR